MRHHVRGLVIAVAVAVACSRTGSDQSVVFSGEAAEALRKQCARDFPENLIGAWTPTPRQIKRADAKITEAIAAEIARMAAKYPQFVPAEYYRQYAGFLRDGRRVLYVNGLRKREVDEAAKIESQRMPWRTEVVAMCDAGPGYFGALLDVETGAVEHFEFNGPFLPAKN